MLDERRLDWAASAFFLVAAGLVFFAPWLEVYVEQTADGVDSFLMTERLGGLSAASGVVSAALLLFSAGMVLGRMPLVGFWSGVLAFLSAVFTYALLHSTLAAELAPERKQELAPGWGISANLLWSGVGLFLLFVHLWGDALWARACQAAAPVDARLSPEDQPETSKATWVVALVLVVLMVVFVCSADPDDKVWKRMMR
jgi:hypothetical protein